MDGTAGSFEACDDIENQIAFSYLVAQRSWEGDPTLGHRLDELDRATDTAENRARARDLCRDAVQWLIDDGKLERVDVTVESLKPGAVAFQVDYYVSGDKASRRAGPFLIQVGAG